MKVNREEIGRLGFADLCAMGGFIGMPENWVFLEAMGYDSKDLQTISDIVDREVSDRIKTAFPPTGAKA